jgi:HEPN domain-containing protein
MVDVAKQVAYWRDGAQEELDVAHDLLEKRRWRHCLFFAHLAVEKLLKAGVSKVTGNVPPRIHNLFRLAELAEVAISTEQRSLLARLNEYHIEGRYPEQAQALPSPGADQARDYLRRAEEFCRWLGQTL